MKYFWNNLKTFIGTSSKLSNHLMEIYKRNFQKNDWKKVRKFKKNRQQG